MLKASIVGVLTAAASIAFVAIASDPGSSPPATVRTTGCDGPVTGQPCARQAEEAGSTMAAGGPKAITIPAIGLHTTIASLVSTKEGGRWTIDPPRRTAGQLQRVYWWSEHAAPAGTSRGTAYFYGHSCTNLACAFNDLHLLSTGDLVRVTTTHGVLSYRVTARPIRLAKTSAGIGSSSLYKYGVANRLVLITCGYVRNGSSPFNWAVIAQLRSAAAGHVVG